MKTPSMAFHVLCVLALGMPCTSCCPRMGLPYCSPVTDRNTEVPTCWKRTAASRSQCFPEQRTIHRSRSSPSPSSPKALTSYGFGGRGGGAVVTTEGTLSQSPVVTHLAAALTPRARGLRFFPVPLSLSFHSCKMGQHNPLPQSPVGPSQHRFFKHMLTRPPTCLGGDHCLPQSQGLLSPPLCPPYLHPNPSNSQYKVQSLRLTVKVST